MMLNKPIFLAGRKFDYICDININKNGNALRKSSYAGQKAFTYDISTHDNDEFCRFQIPPLRDWPLQGLSGLYAICQMFPHLTVFYVGETNNLVHDDSTENVDMGIFLNSSIPPTLLR